MANLFMRFKDGVAKCVTLSYDDGVVNDIRFVEILKKYGLKCTFNINSGEWADRDWDDYQKTHRRMTKERAIELYKNSGFEVAAHGVTHPFLEQLPSAKCAEEIILDRRNLERDYDCIVRGFAYPWGTYSDEVVSTLKDCGIVYARTVEASHSFDIPKDWLRLKSTCHHGDPMLPELTDRFVNGDVPFGPWLFYLWGHSYEFDFNDNWEIIENFAQKVSGRDDIWYATNIEVYDYIADFNRLIFNTELTRVYNPSVRTLWFEYNWKKYSVGPGETVEIG